MNRVRVVTPRRPGQVAMLTAVLMWLAIVLVIPLGALTVTVFTHLGETMRTLATPDAMFALGQSITIAALVLVINGVLGVMGAIVLVRQRFWGRRMLDAMVDMPLALSPVMTGLAFLLLFGRNGILGPALEAIDLRVAFAFPGLLIATLFVSLPFTVREVALVLEELGTSEEESAATLGASSLQTFFFVTLPNIRNGLSIGATLTAARALGEFGAVLVLGGAIAGATQTATTYIYVAMEERQVAGAYGMAMILATAAAGLLVLLQKRHREV